MVVLAAAKPWTYWLAFPLILGSIFAVLGFALNYLLKVVAAKYPRQQR
jgi:hypothetical protein